MVCGFCNLQWLRYFARSIYNELLIKKETNSGHKPIGTCEYSKKWHLFCVPRVAALVENTPKQPFSLWVEIAQKYDLYTNITGGQRIDMFGSPIA